MPDVGRPKMPVMKKVSLSSIDVADWGIILLVLVGGLVLVGTFVIGPFMALMASAH